MVLSSSRSVSAIDFVERPARRIAHGRILFFYQSRRCARQPDRWRSIAIDQAWFF
jgi:hypothetical protein